VTRFREFETEREIDILAKESTSVPSVCVRRDRIVSFGVVRAELD